MNIIFLDIDGVLNSKSGTNLKEKFGLDDKLIVNLKHIIDSVPDTKIVISSSWRVLEYDEIHTSEEIPWRTVLADKLGFFYYTDIIVGDTPNFIMCNKNRRGLEIKQWLDENRIDKKVNQFVIIDDEISDITEIFPNNTLKIDSNVGLTHNDAKSAIWTLTNFGKDPIMSENVFFTSDTHFYHENILKYCNRPFASVEEMNEKLIANWNSVVGKNDIVWHLGDFSFGSKDHIPKIVSKLNGRINLVMGNHDRHKIKFYYESGFNRVYDRQILINGFVILSHAPLQFLNSNCPFVNIYGHVHDSEIYQTYTKNSCCVCVERHDYKPVSWKEIERYFNKKND
jgi:calcineurin-like phosphoesterase family protein